MSAPKDNDDVITINIENSLDASENFEANNLLQKQAIKKIKTLVENRLLKIEKCNNDRKHDTITILGERGSGKTSLLLNLKTVLQDNDGDIEFLKIIDPTLFETKQNILISIISLIADKVKNKDKDWNESLVKLADGLKLLDGVGSDIIKSDLFDDGALILEKGLDHAHSGLNLEKNLNSYISKSLSLIDRKMFVLVFDDIDTNIDKGWMVLETIRKYLTSYKLQVFVSGDWKLYSSLVRMKQWENFDRKIFPESEWQNKKGLVDQLEEQYLIKVLKPEYRIYLENLYHLTKSPINPIVVKGFNSTTRIDFIYNYISNILFNFKNEEQQKEVSDLIKQLPIRTNMKIFYAHFQNQDDVSDLIDTVSNVFLTNTSRFNFTHLDYEDLSTNAVLQEMAKKLYLISSEKFSFEILSQFPMNLSDKNLNLLLMVVNMHLMRSIDTNLHTFFEWLTRFTYLDILGINKQEEDEKNALLSRLKYDSIISMEEQINLISNEYVIARNVLVGFRPVYAYHRYAKDQGYIGVDKFQESGKIDENFLLNILLSKSGLVAHSEQTNISVINMFSFLSDFLQKSEEEASDFLIAMFEEFHHYRGNDHLFGDLKKDDIINNNLYQSLLEWHKLKDNIKIFSIFQINRIWKEFMAKHEVELQSKKFTTAKDFISTQIIVFLNLLITEILFNQGIKKSYASVTSPSNLYRNIEKGYGKNYVNNFYNNYKELDFFKYMYLCPILYCFIDDSNFVIPKKDYWIGAEDKRRILTSFGTLTIQTSNQKEEVLEEINRFKEVTKKNTKDLIASKIAIEKYISISDLEQITKIKTEEHLYNIFNIIDQIKKGEIKTHYQLWEMLKSPEQRITPSRTSILKRFISNIQDDIKTDDTTTS